MSNQGEWTASGILEAVDRVKKLADKGIVLRNGWELRDVITSYSQGILSRDEAYDLMIGGTKRGD